MIRTAHVHMSGKTGKAEHFLQVEYLIDCLIGIPDKQVTFFTPAGIKLLPLVWRPATAASHPVHLRRIHRVIGIRRSFTVFSEKRMHVHPYPVLAGIMFVMCMYFPAVFK